MIGITPSDIRNFLNPIIKKEIDKIQIPDCKVMVCFKSVVHITFRHYLI